jgi:tetratricopeptide (TPR) repeat protein
VGGIASALLLAALMACAWRQTSYWSDSVTLWKHTLDCTSSNPLAHNVLGNALSDRALADGSVDLDKLDRAMAEYRAAIRIKPRYAEAHFNLGVALAAAGEYAEAVDEYRTAIRIEPEYAAALNNLGNTLALGGRLDEALEYCQRAAKIAPEFAPAHCSIGDIWLRRGRPEKAVDALRTAVNLAPDYLYAQCRLGEALSASGRPGEAAAAYRAALKLAIGQDQPTLADALRARIAQCESERRRGK